jgi:hypothetical protein
MTDPRVTLPGVLDGRPVTDAIQEQFPGVWAWVRHEVARGEWIRRLEDRRMPDM